MDKQTLMKIIGENLKRLFFERNLKQTDIADEIGVSHQQISNYINGRSAIPLDIAYKLCRLLNIDLNSLIGMNSSIKSINQDLEKHIRDLEKELLEVYRITKQQEDELKRLRGL